MTLRFILGFAGAVALVSAEPAPCVPVHGSQILGADLARALPLFGALPATMPLVHRHCRAERDLSAHPNYRLLRRGIRSQAS